MRAFTAADAMVHGWPVERRIYVSNHLVLVCSVRRPMSERRTWRTVS